MSGDVATTVMWVMGDGLKRERRSLNESLMTSLTHCLALASDIIIITFRNLFEQSTVKVEASINKITVQLVIL